MLYAEKVSSIMFDVSCMNAPSNICDFFTKANSKHKHETRFSSSGNYYVQTSRLNLNKDSFSRFGANLWNAIPNEFRQLSKGAIKKFSCLFALDNGGRRRLCWSAHCPTKMANSASSTQCTNNRYVLLAVNLIVIAFCKTIYFVTLACFSVILIYSHSLFSYFAILSVMTAVTFLPRPRRLAFAICGRRWQNDVYETKV